MPDNHVVKLGIDQYLNNLELPSVELDDAGMYICFVSDSGLTSAWSYKSVVLEVVPPPRNLMGQEGNSCHTYNLTVQFASFSPKLTFIFILLLTNDIITILSLM